MKIFSSIFIKSSLNASECPIENLPEFAFIGRSNVGKSSLINCITGLKKLAKISSTPGKTSLINHFLINNKWYLVDLPGFGFAKRSKKEIKEIENIISDYFLNRNNITQTYFLIDIRLEPQKIDLEFMQWLSNNNIFFKIIFTKSDKLTKTQLEDNPQLYLEKLFKYLRIQPEYFVSSSKSKTGKELILSDMLSQAIN
ncbi:MAG: YihA family ribosome biogenesis GTP-binding protein [Flavobacteriaceae bacterium]|nr:YihA family ribosome biogenesis GTP-binding protein [Flavobacteriaceae bacterium]